MANSASLVFVENNAENHFVNDLVVACAPDTYFTWLQMTGKITGKITEGRYF